MAYRYGILDHMKQPYQEPIRKITVNLPAKLLEGEMRHTGLGITELLRKALEDQRHRRACQSIAALRGKLDLGMTYAQIKAERE